MHRDIFYNIHVDLPNWKFLGRTQNIIGVSIIVMIKGRALTLFWERINVLLVLSIENAFIIALDLSKVFIAILWFILSVVILVITGINFLIFQTFFDFWQRAVSCFSQRFLSSFLIFEELYWLHSLLLHSWISFRSLRNFILLIIIRLIFNERWFYLASEAW